MNSFRSAIRGWLAAALLGMLAACGGGNSDESSGGTELPPPTTPTPARVEIEQTGLLFTASGQTRQLSARVFDDSGAEIDVPVTWTSSDTSDVALDANGLARAASATGSSQIVASADDVQSLPLLAVVAAPAAGTVVVDDTQIVSGPVETDPGAEPDLANTYTVVLAGSEVPTVDTLLIGSGSIPVAGRVVAAEAGSGGVLVTLKLVPINELLPEVDIDQTLDLAHVPTEIAADVAEEFAVASDGGGMLVFTARAATAAPIAKASYRVPKFLQNCKVDSAGFDDDNPPMSFDTAPKITVAFNPRFEITFNSREQRLLLKASPTVAAEFAPTITVAFEGNLTCKAELFSKRIPVGGWLSFYVGGVIPFGVGLELDGKLTVAEAQIGVKSQVGNTLETGLACTFFDCEFRREMSEFTVTHEPVLDLPGLEDLRFEPTLQVFGYAEAAIGNSSFRSLRFSLLEARAGPELAASFAPAITQALDYGYRSGYELTLAASARPGDDIADVLELLSLNSLAQSQTEIATDALASSPSGTMSATTTRFVAGDTVGFTVTLDQTSTKFLGLYNISEVLLVRKRSDTSTEIVARRSAAENDLVFDFSITANSSGTADEFFSFAVTKLFATDLLALEIAQGPVPAAAVVLQRQSVGSSSGLTCTITEGCDPAISETRNSPPDEFAQEVVASSANSYGGAESSGRSELLLDRNDGTFARATLACSSAGQRGSKDDFGASNDSYSIMDFRVETNTPYRIEITQAEANVSGDATTEQDQALASFRLGSPTGAGGEIYQSTKGNVVLDGPWTEESGLSSGVLPQGSYQIRFDCNLTVWENIWREGNASAGARGQATLFLGAP